VDPEEVQRLEVVLRQLVVTTGLPAEVMRWTSHFSEVVVVAGHSLPQSQVTVGHLGTSALGCTYGRAEGVRTRESIKPFTPGSAMPAIH
jgi:hypothetical protein